MSSYRFFQFLFVFGAALFAQNTNTYLGPDHKIPGNPQMVRVQILVYNDPNPKGVTITKASFDGTSIPLKPRDIYGYRGQASFQKPPGKYKLKWEVEGDKKVWPRTVDHETEVFLDERDFWIQITINGNNAEIS
jgi:hypothetical protein